MPPFLVTLILFHFFSPSHQQTDATLSPEEQSMEDRYADVMESYCIKEDIPEDVIRSIEACRNVNKEIKHLCENKVYGANVSLNDKRRIKCTKGPEIAKQFSTCYSQEYRKAVQQKRVRRRRNGVQIPRITREQWNRMSEAEKSKRRKLVEQYGEQLKREFQTRLICMEKVLERASGQS